MRACNRAMATIAAGIVAILTVSTPALADDGRDQMQRLYNPYSGEHFYTADLHERDYLVRVGWNYEGIAWVAPREGDDVYRLYNPYAGDHHYTTSAVERDHLVSVGWNYEGVGWKSGGDALVSRQYNPNAKTGAHNFTTSSAEETYLVTHGWRGEGIAWLCCYTGVEVRVITYDKDTGDFALMPRFAEKAKGATIIRFGGMNGRTAWYDVNDPDTLYYPLRVLNEDGQYMPDDWDSFSNACYIDATVKTIKLPPAVKTVRYTAPATGELMIGEDWIDVLFDLSLSGDKDKWIDHLDSDNPDFTREQIAEQVDEIWPDLLQLREWSKQKWHGLDSWSSQPNTLITEFK